MRTRMPTVPNMTWTDLNGPDAEYIMAVDSLGPDRTLIFLHIPKTGGRTLATVLRRQYGPSRVFEAYSHPPDIRI